MNFLAFYVHQPNVTLTNVNHNQYTKTIELSKSINTAGLDLSLGEFTEVGNIVEEYASDNATIVVGTVIDPEMTDDLKVTVVATGLDKRAEEIRVVSNNSNYKPDGALNMQEIELPTVLRRKRQEAMLDEPAPPADAESSRGSLRQGGNNAQAEYGALDIPTFLRRQAD